MKNTSSYHDRASPSDDFRLPTFYAVILSLLTMLAHLIYLIFFFSSKIYFMGVFNIFSVAFYAYGVVFSVQEKDTNKFIKISLVEIVAHAILATLFSGWDYGFQMFLICMIPVPYMFTLRRTPLNHIVSGAVMLMFVALRIACYDLSFRLSDRLTLTPSSFWYIFNSITSFIVILQITLLFRVRMRKLNDSLVSQNEMLQKAASVDSLTGLFNRRAMQKFLDRIHSSNQGYCVIMSDVDFFKKVNDTYGHSAGDAVLTEIAQCMLSAVPSEGYVCRWGGEEFLIVIPGADLSKGIEIAQTLRKDISEIVFTSDDGTFSVTSTFGVYEAHAGMHPDKAINIADNRLYIGKDSGRNCVISKG
jgi:diguanylate cyclase (GGDEF)-like protein